MLADTGGMSTQRHFFRCPDCLGVWSAELTINREPRADGRPSGPWGQWSSQREAIAPIQAAGCPYACDTTKEPEHLGVVQASGNLQRLDGAKAECDSSCTHARGCKCDCPCGGVNHGAGILADIPVFSNQGNAKARFKSAPKSLDQAVVRANEWRAIVARVEALFAPVQPRIDALYKKRSEKRWLDAGDFRELVDLQNLTRSRAKLPSLRTHQGRMKSANELIEVLKTIGSD